MARRYLIDKILPARQVHLIGGPSGIGKTRWIVHLLKDWLEGKPVLGFKSHPEKMMYFATDRNEESLEETFQALDIGTLFPWKSLLNTTQSIDEIIKSHPDVKLFVFDPIMLFVPDYKYIDYGTVATFLRNLTKLCVKYDVTIIGVVHTAKMKEGALFVNPRERLLGSAAWGAYAETLFILGSNDFEHPEKSKIRNVNVLPRNSAEFVIHWKFNSHGIPTPCNAPAPSYEESPSFSIFLSHIPENSDLTTKELQKIATDLSISQATFFRHLKKAVEQLDLVVVMKGIYRKFIAPVEC
jgi:hypothetical protein